MANTILLDIAAWDLVLDAQGNIAVASAPYSLAQDAASAIKTFLGECYWDTTLGVPYLSEVLGRTPQLALIKALFVRAAEAVPGVASARCYLTEITDRVVSGQVQVTGEATGQVSAANFTVVNPQGAG